MSAEQLELNLVDFGLSRAEAMVLIALSRYGQLGIMDLARRTELGRNVVYRAIEKLIADSLISVVYLNRSKEYLANGPDSLKLLIESKQTELNHISSLLPHLSTAIAELQSQTEYEQVKTYVGTQGLKYVNWNLTKANGEYRVYEVSHIHQYLDESFTERFRKTIARKKLTTFDLTNSSAIPYYLDDSEQWLERTNYRYIDPAILEIRHEIYIYNNVVTLLDYSGDIPRCTEIYNQRLADMQKQLYDTIWLGAKEMALDKTTLSRFVDE